MFFLCNFDITASPDKEPLKVLPFISIAFVCLVGGVSEQCLDLGQVT